MNPSLMRRLEDLQSRFEELGMELSDPQVIQDQNKFRKFSQDYSQLEPVIDTFTQYCAGVDELANLQGMLKEDDAEIREMAQMELAELEKAQADREAALQVHLLPRDPADDNNIFLEIRAGTGGDEAAIFAGNLFGMYERYAASQNWQIEVLSTNHGDHGGYKEIISRIVGHGAYSRLKFESGAHRVQRVPETESQGRIHTSACTVAVLPELDAVDAVDIETKDLRIDTYRASGAGGQHINKTDSAVRITHLPSGIVVECQEERSQHKNRARAMSLLQSRILDIQREQQNSEQAATRKALVGSGDRSERIRTYNYPQGRVTDHRINLTLYKLDGFMAGELDQLIQPLIQEHQAALMAELGA
ncbi:MAG: peptide chain release factor 1 [Oceanococcus sp.]